MLKTNKKSLVKMAVSAEVVHPSAEAGYKIDYNGVPRIGLGTSGIKYNVVVGDPVHGYAEEEHLEPGLSISNKNLGEITAYSILSCIGNEVKITTGDAKGAKGYITGKHGNFIVWFKPDDQKKINIGDKMRVKAWGVGLKIDGFEEVYIHKLDPELLEKMRITIEEDKLVVPVTAVFPAYIMGSGIGRSPLIVDYDIQTTCPEVVDELNLKNLRLGDIVALKDQLNWWGRGYSRGAITIGVIIHGWSHVAGHGPGVTTLISALSGKIIPRIESQANIAKYLCLK